MYPIRKTVFLLCAVSILSVGSASGQNTETSPDTIKLTLSEAKTFALTNNKTIIASKMDVEIARKKVGETVTIGLPQVNFDGNYQHIFKVPNFAIPTTGFTDHELVSSSPNFSSNYVDDLGLWQYYYQGASLPIMEKDNATFDFKVTQLIFSGE